MKKRRRRCRETGKVRFTTFLAAHARAMTMREHGERMHAYFCKDCGGFHMGHNSKGPRKWKHGQ